MKSLSVADPLGFLSELLRGGVGSELVHAFYYLGELFETELAGRGIKGGSERCGDSIPLPLPEA